MVRQPAAVQHSVRGLVSRKFIVTVVHPLNVAMIGLTTSLVCLVYITSLLLSRLSPSTSTSFWLSEASDVGVMAVAVIYVISHVIVLFERHLAASRPLLHAQLVTRYGIIMDWSSDIRCCWPGCCLELTV